MRLRALALLFCLVSAVPAKRVLYVTHSAGFRHDSIPLSRQVLQQLAPEALEVTATEDLSLLSAENLRGYDAVFFFTSGELPLSEQQKIDLLAFVREGKGFGGVHSATDTLYNWPEYGELIGGYFDGHPWAQEVGIDIEDPDHPAMRHLAPRFRIADEIYQFRNFSRDRVRVLMTLDTRTVDPGAPGVNRTDGDFALAWCRNYGQGRVFYTALGHGEETWRDPRFQTMLRNGLLWLTGDIEADASPRRANPAIAPGGIVSAAARPASTGGMAAPGSLISIYGSGLTSGSTLAASSFPLPVRLAGAWVEVNGSPVPLLYASPAQINAQLPFGLEPGQATVAVRTPDAAGQAQPVQVEPAAPGIFAVVRSSDSITVYATGLGRVSPPVEAGAAAPAEPLSRTLAEPVVTIGGTRAAVTFSGLAPGFAGLYQVNASIPAGLPSGPLEVVFEVAGRSAAATAGAR